MKRRFLAPLSGGLLLLAALVGFTGCFLTVYQDLPLAEDHGELLLLLAAVFALLSLAIWSLPKFRLLAAGAALLLLAAVGYRLRVLLADGAQLVLDAILKQVYPKLSGSFSSSLSSSDRLTAALLALVLLLALLALLIGWSILRVRRWWLTLLLTLLPILPALVCGAVPHALSTALLVGCWAALLLLSLYRRSEKYRQSALALVLLPICCLLAGLLFHFFPTEDFSRPSWSYSLSLKVNSFTDRYLPFLSFGRSDSGSVIGSVSVVDLTQAGPRSYEGRVALAVKTSYRGILYLRGTSYAVYQDNQWSNLSGSSYRSFQSMLTDAQKEYSSLTFPTTAYENGKPYSICVRNFSLSNSYVYQPYCITDALSKFDLDEIQDSALYSPSGLRYHTYSCALGLLDLSSLSGTLDDDVSRSVMDLYQQYVEKTYLSVDFSQQLERYLDQLLQPISSEELAALEDVYPLLSEEARLYLAYAQQVTDVLAQLCEYDINTPAISAGTDFVEYFLRTSHRGYCVHFASAATLMLRYLGVPARYVSGFCFRANSATTINVLDSSSHAWVEIYLPGYGWYPVEVTPASFLPQEETPVEDPGNDEGEVPTQSSDPVDPPASSEVVSQAPSEPLTSADPVQPSAAPSPSDTPDQASGNGPSASPLPGAVKWLLGAAILLALGWLGQDQIKRSRRRRLKAPDTRRAALYGYGCLCRLVRWGGQVDISALDLARKAKFSAHSISPEERDAMAALVEAERRRIPEGLRGPRRLLFHWLWGIPKT